MSTYYIKFLRPIILPESETLASIAFDGTRIYSTNSKGDTLYILSNSGTVLNTVALPELMNYIAYDRLNLNFVGYDLDDPYKLKILDENYNTSNEITLQYDVAAMGEVDDITYNLQSDTITVVQPKDSNAIDDSGNVINNTHLNRSYYKTSNVSGAYMFNGIANGTKNYITKTDLAGNILEYYQTPNNMEMISISIQGADIYRTNYYALFSKNGAFYLANLCFANPVPENFVDNSTTGSNTFSRNTFGFGATRATNPFGYAVGSRVPTYGATDPYAAAQIFSAANDNLGTRGLLPIYSRFIDDQDTAFDVGGSIGGRSDPTVAAFFTFAALLVCNWEDSRDYCGVPSITLNTNDPNAIFQYDSCVYKAEREIQADNMELMIYVFALIVAIKSQQSEKRRAQYEAQKEKDDSSSNACCPDFNEAAFYENTQSLSFTNSLMNALEGYNYHPENPLL